MEDRSESRGPLPGQCSSSVLLLHFVSCFKTVFISSQNIKLKTNTVVWLPIKLTKYFVNFQFRRKYDSLKNVMSENVLWEGTFSNGLLA